MVLALRLATALYNKWLKNKWYLTLTKPFLVVSQIEVSGKDRGHCQKTLMVLGFIQLEQ